MENFLMLSRIARSLRLDDVKLETFKGSELDGHKVCLLNSIGSLVEHTELLYDVSSDTVAQPCFRPSV